MQSLSVFVSRQKIEKNMANVYEMIGCIGIHTNLFVFNNNTCGLKKTILVCGSGEFFRSQGSFFSGYVIKFNRKNILDRIVNISDAQSRDEELSVFKHILLSVRGGAVFQTECEMFVYFAEPDKLRNAIETFQRRMNGFDATARPFTIMESYHVVSDIQKIINRFTM